MTNDQPPCAIRRATFDDAAALAVLGAATFTETFGHLYPPEDLRAFLEEAHSVPAWARRLTDPQRAVWVAAFGDEPPIGFVVAGACKLPVESREPAAGEIQQLYLQARFQKLRMGSRLMERALDWLEAEGRSPLYVGVWSENYGAQRFYGRYGFVKVGEYGFPVGKTVDREHIMKR